MRSIDRIESERGGKFIAVLQGAEVELPSPLDLSWQEVASVVSDRANLAPLVPQMLGLAPWKARDLVGRWLAWYGLPTEARDAEALVYYVDRYADAIEIDLLAIPGCPPLSELWQTRQWRLLLSVIRSLPPDSHFAAATMGDEEHVRAILEAQAGKEQEKLSPSLIGWSREIAALADLNDAVRALTTVTIAMNSKKGSRPPKMEPYARPSTALAKITHEVRQAKHDTLADRLLARNRRSHSAG